MTSPTAPSPSRVDDLKDAERAAWRAFVAHDEFCRMPERCDEYRRLDGDHARAVTALRGGRGAQA